MKSLRVLVGFVLMAIATHAQAQSVKELWQPLLNQPGMATYFSGLFETLGIRIAETGEEVTVTHRIDHFEIAEGIVDSAVDYVVDLRQENVSNLLQHGADGQVDSYESYRIMAVLFTPLTRAALQNPMMNKSFPQKLAHIENHVHVYLKSPANDEYVAHTLLYLNKKWLVIEGIHGDAKRIFTLKPEDALVYQREVFKAEKADTRRAWKKFMKFYLSWRDTVSVRTEN